MGTTRLLTAPVRSIVRFPLFQLAIVVLVILWLQAADAASLPGELFSGLDRLVGTSVALVASLMTVKSFTQAWLVSGFMIAYVYLGLLLIFALVRLAFVALADLAGRHNVFWLRNAIARERGIAAYRAWVPLEKIRPQNIAQPEWEERYAWPANNLPPDRPLLQRLAIGILINVGVIVLVLVLLQAFTPFPVLTWLGRLVSG
ncbi:MAG TPA: hypothetical protein VFW22_13595 [Pseudolabrys sp.]|nr:hypothetical protein [Pseudolabrys sp.]